MKKIALQLVTRGGSRYLPFVFDSLKRQSCQDWELFVLDNGSNAEEAKEIYRLSQASDIVTRFERVEPNIGFAGGHNRVFGWHHAPYVVLLNDDAFLEPMYLAELLRLLEQDAHAGAAEGAVFRWNFDERDQTSGGRTEIIDTFGLIRSRGWKVSDLRAGEEQSLPCGVEPWQVFGVSGCLPMYRRSAVLTTSPDRTLFDPTFVSYKEDVELATRLQAAGYTAYTVPTALAYHRRSFAKGMRAVQSEEVLRQSYRNHLWIVIMHAHHLSFFSLFSILFFEKAKALFWLVRRPRILWQALKETWMERQNVLRKRRFFSSLSSL